MIFISLKLFIFKDGEKNFNKIAKNVDLEIEALKKVKNSLGKFYQLIETIMNCQSKVILCGVGKSGLIVSKISSILSSTTPFYYFK